MFTANPAAAFATELAFWRDALTRYSPEQLATGESDDDWSIGQLYAHLGSSALRFHLPAAERALASPDASGELTERGRHALSGQELPPVKVPASPQYTPRQPADADAIRALLTEVETAFAATAARVGSMPDAIGTADHPSMGHLKATHWLALVPAHFYGHRRQLARLDARVSASVRR